MSSNQPPVQGESTPAPPVVRPIRVAHRGGNGRRALRRALAARVDWIEADIWLHYGRLVARHDPALGRLPITYSRRSLSLALLPYLTLDALLQALHGHRTRVLIDLKGTQAGLSGALVDALARRDAHKRAALCGQEWGPLDHARRLDPAVEVIFSLGRPEHLETFIARRRDKTAPPWTSCNHRLLTPHTIDRLKAVDSRIIAWTVDSEERAQTLLSWGVDGITSNRYAMLNRLRKAPDALTHSLSSRSGEARA